MRGSMIFLFFLLPVMASAESLYFEGVPTIKNGYYEEMVKSQTALIVENNVVRVCGFSTYSDGQRGFISRRWSQMGPYLYVGRDKVGTFDNNRLYVEQSLPEGKKQIFLLQWNPEANTYIYSIKHPSLGGFQVEGLIKDQSNAELDEACKRSDTMK